MLESWSDTAVRLAAFVGVFLVMALLEAGFPRRARKRERRDRWPTNLAIVVLDSLLVRALANLVVPVAALAAAVTAEQRGWGLLNALDWPAGLEIAIGIVALDFALWLQHLVSHKVPLLWRLHQVHHADPEIDVTTAIRFHPVEIGLSMVWKVLWVLALGVSPFAVLLFEIILNALAMFNHANLALPRWLDATLRLMIVTPDMHRVHHSVLREEHNSNYGFNLALWDRAFGTYVAQPRCGHEGMTIGLSPYQSDAPTQLWWSLVLPFRARRDVE